MSFQVRLSPRARADIVRLAQFLIEGSRPAAERSVSTIEQAVLSLATMPGRGRPASDNRRELVVPFGGHAYVIQYRIEGDLVLVARIKHARERR